MSADVAHLARRKVSLRPYQLRGIQAIRDAIARGSRRVLFVLPTGGGKTVVASEVVLSAIVKSRRVVFLAHRKELIDQTVRKLLALGVPEDCIGVVRGNDRSRYRPTAPVQVASIQTLVNRQLPPCDLLIIDEAHRALAASYRKVAEAYPKAIVLGLTATPYRADGRGLGEAFDALVPCATPRTLIDEGFLVEPVIYSTPRPVDLSGVRVKGHDYDGEELAALMDQRALVGDIVDHWRRHLDGVRTVVFACSVDHSKHVAERFREAGVAAEHLDGETDEAERDAILARLESGETLVVSNMGVLCEGWDQPKVKGLILARPTKSTGLYLQMAGRILRPDADNPAQRAIILDHAGCVHEHGFPQDEREYTLEDKPKRAAKGPSVRTCDHCYCAFPSRARTCPECGHDYGAEVDARAALEERAGELVEVKPPTQEEKRAAWDAFLAEARSRGFKPGWAMHRYREQFGTNPPNAWRGRQDVSTVTPEERREDFLRLYAQERDQGYKRGWAWAKYRAKYGEPPLRAWFAGTGRAEQSAEPLAPTTTTPRRTLVHDDDTAETVVSW